MMRIGKYCIENVNDDYEHSRLCFYINHKYWYFWQVFIDFFFIHFYIEICRTDWNRQYKNSCKNYTSDCKHNMDCNECKHCYEKIQ